jgi:hypothetical protein
MQISMARVFCVAGVPPSVLIAPKLKIIAPLNCPKFCDNPRVQHPEPSDLSLSLQPFTLVIPV